MNLGTLVEHLADRGIHLEADRDRLKVRAAKGMLDADDWAELSARKAELLAYLAMRPVPEPLVAVPRHAELPLSFAQQRLWFLACLGDAEAYRISAALKLEGALDPAALGQAFCAIVRRHEVLRTCVVEKDGRALQRIDPPPDVVLQCEDLFGLEAPDVEARSRAAAFATLPFDLVAGPLFRAKLWRLGPARHVLVVAVHHIVFDGWSLGVLMHELSTLYTACLGVTAPPLPELPVQYADYAAWQQRRLAGGRIERLAAHWRERLSGSPAQSTIPSDRPRSAATTMRGRAVHVVIPAAVAQRVRALARQTQATPFMVLLAAWALLIGRSSGQDDVVVGSPVANRSRREFEPLIGLFANTLALRIDLSAAPTLAVLIERVRAVTLAAYEHQDMPFDQVVDAVAAERHMHHHPLFQTVLVLQGAARRAPLDLSGIAVTPLPLEVSSVKFDLMMEVAEVADRFEAALEYNSDLYDHATAEAVAARWALLLEAMVRPGAALTPVHALPVMMPDERDRLLWVWGTNTRPYRRDRTLAAAFAEQVEQRPNAVAVVCGAAALTYRDLDLRANRLAWALFATGRVGPDVLVGLAIERSLDLIVALLGILKVGAAYLPLDPDDPAERLAFMLDDVPVLVTSRAMAERLPVAPARVMCVDDQTALIGPPAAMPPASDAGPANLAYAVYTSGSTGEPKGVLIEQRSVLRLVLNAGYAALGPDSVVLHLAPLSFDASTFEIWGPLLNGGRLIVMEPGTPSLEAIGEAIRRHGVNTLWLTAGLFHAMVEERLADLAPLQQLLAGGDVLPPADVMRVLSAHPHLTVINGYGPTETTTFAACHRLTAGMLVSGSVAIGRPIGNTHVCVCDRNGELVPTGVAGELFIGGDGVARNYRKRPALTAERFVPDPWRPGERLYRTGDLVRWRADGVLEFLGRLDNQIKIRGFRVEPGEVEATLLMHPDVAAAAVVVQVDAKGGKQLAGYVVPRSGTELTAAGLSGWVGDRLPAYLQPRLWQVLAAIPLTANGKVDRARLPALQAAPRPQTDGARHLPVEAILADIWARLLDRPTVGRHDNFFELGGDSILSLQIVARCRQAGLRLLPRQVFEHQTIAELARHVEPDGGHHDVDQRPIVGPVAAGPIQKWFYALNLHRPQHFNQSVLLDLASGVDAMMLRRVLAALITHHDMLRLRVADIHAQPRQWIAPPDDEVPLDIVAPSDLVGVDTARTLERAQASLDLENGPILRAVLFPSAPGLSARLLLVIHHLAVDGVSWRILLEDMAMACEAALSGRAIVLPPKTMAFPQWVEILKAHAGSEAATRELTYWQAMAPGDHLKDVPTASREANVVGTAQKVQRVLPPDLTRDLLQRSSQAHNTRVEDILVAALLLSSCRISGCARLRIDLESHGRDSFVPSLDLSRTVGWFSCLYPLELQLEGESLREALIGVKEQLRRVPGSGLAYGLGRWLVPRPDMRLPPESGIVFNYLGQFDQMLTSTRLMRVSEESNGPNQASTNRRTCLVEILSLVFDGSLRMEWHYHPACHDRDRIEAWADCYLDVLIELLSYCCNSDQAGCTPADFPSVALGFAELEQIQALAAASLSGGGG
jgi:amino acid adenylation domain-containing protein/non-ribosomal peptide synthase protein (TIGR01720 family)